MVNELTSTMVKMNIMIRGENREVNQSNWKADKVLPLKEVL